MKYCVVEYFGDYPIDNQKYWDAIFTDFDSALSAAKEVFERRQGDAPEINNGQAPSIWEEEDRYYIEIYEGNDAKTITEDPAIKYLY